MKIAGLQKLTLLDYPGKMACTVFLSGCNFRCPFCHNYELLGSDVEPFMEVEEFLEFLKGRKGILEGVCITGGEPTIYPELPEFIRSVRELGFKIKLDTNGYNPKMLQEIVEAGLVDYVAMDIKSDPEGYACITDVAVLDIERIEKSIRFLMEEKTEYEFRTTIVDPFHDETTMERMGKWLHSLGNGKKIKRIFLQPFVDRETVPAEGLCAPETVQIASFVSILQPEAQYVGVRGLG